MLLLLNKSESLECAKVVVLKLSAILFYSGIHFKPLKLWKKVYIAKIWKDLKGLKYSQGLGSHNPTDNFQDYHSWVSAIEPKIALLRYVSGILRYTLR